MGKTEKLLNKIIVIALFSALCCAATFIQIRMPAGDFVHLGNFVMIISALLLGGIAGGLTGSLGMGLYDIIFYTQKPSTIIRTIALKFLIGFIVGSVFRLVLKKKLKTNILLYISAAFSLVIFIASIVFFAMGDKSNLSFSSGLNSVVSDFLGSGKSVKISLYIPIFAGVFTIGTLVAAIFSNKLSKRSQAALFAITIAVLVNIVGEFFLRWLLEGLMLDGFDVSLVTATSKIPGSLITGFISIFLAVLIYEPIYKAVGHTALFNDDTKGLVEEDINTTEEENDDAIEGGNNHAEVL